MLTFPNNTTGLSYFNEYPWAFLEWAGKRPRGRYTHRKAQGFSSLMSATLDVYTEIHWRTQAEMDFLISWMFRFV